MKRAAKIKQQQHSLTVGSVAASTHFCTWPFLQAIGAESKCTVWQEIRVPAIGNVKTNVPNISGTKRGSNNGHTVAYGECNVRITPSRRMGCKRPIFSDSLLSAHLWARFAALFVTPLHVLATRKSGPNKTPSNLAGLYVQRPTKVWACSSRTQVAYLPASPGSSLLLSPLRISLG